MSVLHQQWPDGATGIRLILQTIVRAYRETSLENLTLRSTTMIGRRQFALNSVSAAAAAAFGSSLYAADGKRPAAHDHSEDDVFASCAKACSDCQRACDSCSTHCTHLLLEGEKEHAVTLGTCLDCSDFCAAASQIVSRKGPFAALICESCATACDRCATECEKFPKDEHMMACAEECRRCEKACKAMLPQIAHAAG
jgi:hypothetical protein